LISDEVTNKNKLAPFLWLTVECFTRELERSKLRSHRHRGPPLMLTSDLDVKYYYYGRPA